MNNLDLIRAAVVKANPEKWEPYCSWDATKKDSEPIRLADVLLMLHSGPFERLMFVTDAGVFGEVVAGQGARGAKIEATGYQWDLRNDDLSKQSPECLAFLAGILK